MPEVVIAGAARTPIGGFQGELSSITATALGGVAIKAALDGAGLKDPDELLMGCVLPAGQGQAPARQAGFAAGLSQHVPAQTLNKMCGSGMATIAAACDSISLGRISSAVAGGMESMSNAPYILPKMRGGARLGHSQVSDHMFLDGLEDAYDKGRLMGTFAEDCAEKYQFTRKDQDAYAKASLDRALVANSSGAFDNEIARVEVEARRTRLVVGVDEQPQTARPDKISRLKPAFRTNGTVTAANASSISDGAAAVVLADRQSAETNGIPIRAIIRGHATHAQAPGWFTTAPIPAAQKLLATVGWKAEDVDLWEVNEAFAIVPMAFMAEMSVAHEKLNVNGGACSLGHPIGASGTRIVVTLLNAMEIRGLKRGVAAICIGGGEGMAIAIERP